MNRPYVFRGHAVPGIYQRCAATCPPDKCDRHRWQYEVELPAGPNGRRLRDAKGGFATAKEAIEARAEVLRQHTEGTLALGPKMTLGEWLPRWLEARIERGELRPGTAADYRDSITRYLIPRLGHMKLTDLRAAHITAMYDAMRRDRNKEIKEAKEINEQRRAEAAAKNKVKHSGHPRVPHLVKVPRPLGPLTLRRINNTLSGALKSAVKAGLIARNPAPDAELPKAIQPKVKIWTAEQLGTFLDAIEGKRLYALYHLAAFAGMRRGELCGISWDDVDLKAGRIIVRWQITDQGYRDAIAAQKQGRHGEYRSKPKTRAGEDRIVDLDSASIKVLKKWRKAQAEERFEWGSVYVEPVDEQGNPYHLVFTRENGAPLDPGRTYTDFVKLVREAGLSHLKLHGLRHMNISLQLEAGVSETVIAMRVGHTPPPSSARPTATSSVPWVNGRPKRPPRSSRARARRRARNARSGPRKPRPRRAREARSPTKPQQ